MNAHPIHLIFPIPDGCGREIREAREALGWSQAELAARAGSYQQTVDRIERGATRSSRTIPALREALGLPTWQPPSEKAIRLGQARRRANFATATAAAEHIGIKTPTYIHHENGTRDYDEESALIYATAFCVTPAWLLFGDQAKLGPVQPDHKALPAKETREGEVRTAVEPSRVSELREQIEELSDLLHALDKIGDGIGGADGYAVSAVALNAKSIADNALGIAKVLGG